jgi:hypothetical protein
MRLQFERYGSSPLLGLCAVQWSSADVVAAFPKLPANAEAIPANVAETEIVVAVVDTVQPDGQWHKRKARQRVVNLFVFFEKAKQYMPGGSDPLSPDALLSEYQMWLRKQGDVGLGRSQFREWWHRYVFGWRIGKRQRFELTEM